MTALISCLLFILTPGAAGSPFKISRTALRSGSVAPRIRISPLNGLKTIPSLTSGVSLPLPSAAPGLAPSPMLDPVAKPLASLPLLTGLMSAELPDGRAVEQAPVEGLKSASIRFFFKPDDSSQASAPEIDVSLDETAALLEHHEEVEASDSLQAPDGASDFKYLLVPGFNWDAVPDYLEPNRRHLESLGLNTKIIETDPLGTSEVNRAIIIEALKRARKPVIFIAHSMGGNHVIDALLAAPELQKKVAAIVTLQTPYFGTPAADWILRHPVLRNTGLVIARIIHPLRALRSSPFFRRETFREASHEARGGLPQTRPGIDPRIGLYSIATRVGHSAPMKIITELSSHWMSAFSGRDNDGVVATDFAIVPGARFARLDDVSHIDLISDTSLLRRRFIGVHGQADDFAKTMTSAILRWVFSGSGPHED